MKRKMMAALLAAPFVLGAGVASAEEPVRLTDGQMDAVSAGGSALAIAGALAADSIAFTSVATLAEVTVLASIPLQATTINVVGSTSGASSVSATGGSVP